MADIWGGQASTGRYGKKKTKQPKGTKLWGGQVSTGRYGDPGDMRAKAAAKALDSISGGAGIGQGGKPPKTTPGGQTSPAPVVQKTAAAAEDAAAARAKLISDYGLARAEILKSIAPQIQGFYSDAAGDLSKVVGGVSQDVRDRLFGMGEGGQYATTARGNDFINNDQNALDRITASYNPDAIKNAAMTLGSAIPGEALLKQGATYAGAAAFAPGAALQQTTYDMGKVLNDAKVTNEEASKVSASTSKLMGFVADAYGNPIMGKNGKPIPLPEEKMTPYQQASLGLSAARLESSNKLAAARIDLSRYNNDRDYALAVDKANATDKRYYAGLQLRTVQTKLSVEKAGIDAKRIDSSASKVAGYIVLKDGSVPRQKNGQPYAVAKTASEKARDKKGPSSTAVSKALTMAETFYKGVAPTLRADGSESKPGKPPVKYQVALRRLTPLVGFNKSIQILNSFYQPGEGGRPLINFKERKKLIKKGVPKATITQLQNDWHNATTPEGKQAAIDRIEALLAQVGEEIG